MFEVDFTLVNIFFGFIISTELVFDNRILWFIQHPLKMYMFFEVFYQAQWYNLGTQGQPSFVHPTSFSIRLLNITRGPMSIWCSVVIECSIISANYFVPILLLVRYMDYKTFLDSFVQIIS